MTVLPISHDVDVNITREDNFPTIQGFGTPLIVTSDSTGPINDTVRTKVYSNMDEVADDWDSDDEPYIAARTIFSQPVSPPTIKIGFRENGTGDDYDDQLDAIAAYDNDFYQVIPTREIRGVAADENAFLAWIEGKKKLGFMGSNEAGVKALSPATALPNRAKGQWDRTGVFYSEVAAQYPEAAAAAYVATRNFDQPNSAYTLKFKRAFGITPLNQPSGVVRVIGGFVEGQGLNMQAGNYANVFVNVGGVLNFEQGNTLSGAFFDEIHAADWILARTQEELLGILATNPVVQMTDNGVEKLASGVRAVMDRALAAGLLASDIDDAGRRIAPYEVTPQRVRAISAAQRRNRISPSIAGKFRYAGAVHYVTVNYTMTF